MTIEKQAADAGAESTEARPRDRANLLACLRVQAYGCARLGSPFYAALLERIGADVEAGGSTWNILRRYSAEPPDAAVALRFLGAVHRLVLEGRAPGLTRHYPSVGGDGDPDAAWVALRTLLAPHGPALAPTFSARRKPTKSAVRRPLSGDFSPSPASGTYRSGYLRLLAWLAWHLFVVLWDEPTLLARFGERYARYRAATNRWMPRSDPGPRE